MEQSSNLFDLQLDQPSINYLSEAARWSRFLSVLGFIYCGFMFIFGLLLSTLMRSMPAAGDAGVAFGITAIGSSFFGILLIILSVIMFFPALYLWNFSSGIRKAFNNNDQPSLTESLKNLKSLFKFYGILFIVVLSIYALALIAAIVGALVGRH